MRKATRQYDMDPSLRSTQQACPSSQMMRSWSVVDDQWEITCTFPIRSRRLTVFEGKFPSRKLNSAYSRRLPRQAIIPTSRANISRQSTRYMHNLSSPGTSLLAEVIFVSEMRDFPVSGLRDKKNQLAWDTSCPTRDNRV